MGPCSPKDTTPTPTPGRHGVGGTPRSRNGMDLSVMAGLDPAIHANAAIEGEHGPLRASSGTTRVRVDARLEGGHDGWVRARRRPHPNGVRSELGVELASLSQELASSQAEAGVTATCLEDVQASLRHAQREM